MNEKEEKKPESQDSVKENKTEESGKAKGKSAKSGSININVDSLKSLGGYFAKMFSRYATFLIFVTIAVIYVFVVYRINVFSNPTISDTDVTSEPDSLPTLRIDEGAAVKLQSLEDNSVNVQTLFDENRQNPFD